MKLEIRNTDGIGDNTKVFSQDGLDLTGVLHPVAINISMGDVVRAEMEIIIPQIMLGLVETGVYMINPKTMERELLKALEFESGRVEL